MSTTKFIPFYNIYFVGLISNSELFVEDIYTNIRVPVLLLNYKLYPFIFIMFYALFYNLNYILL
jgi:hypothetical protein